MVLWQK